MSTGPDGYQVDILACWRCRRIGAHPAWRLGFGLDVDVARWGPRAGRFASWCLGIG